jgi:alkylhydroperoxidase/carboxymuconolactone decarboxylase family protein YurZ
MEWAASLLTDSAPPMAKESIMSDTTNEDAPVLDLLARMTADSVDASNLDLQTLVLVRIAALVAVGAPPVSYALNLEVGEELGLDADSLRGVLTAIAPIVGTARVAAATGNIVKALAAEIELADLEVAELDDESDE